jgi:phosphatidate cytidylyltransferase
VRLVLSIRILSALVLIPIALVATYLGGVWFAGLVAVFAALATIEFYQLARRLGANPSMLAGTALSAALAFAALSQGTGLGASLFILVLAALLLERVLRQDFTTYLLDWSSTVAGSAYIGGMLCHAVLLRGLERGFFWVATTLVTTWVSDTAAYLVGVRWGRRPFFPRVSPRKTVEGAIAGIAVGTATGLGLAVWLLGLSVPEALGFGLVLCLATTFGDLAESLIKRQAGVKDSGRLIPGHGGALDRIDSLLFAAVVVYYYAVWIVRVGP